MNTSHLDYITVSFPMPDTFKPYDVLPHERGGFEVVSVEKGIRQYKNSYHLRNGGKLYFNVHDNVKPHVLLEMSGLPLDAMRDAGMSDMALLSHITSVGVLNVTRLDYCINVYGYSSINHLVEARRDRRVKCKSQEWPRIYDELNPQNGDTQYIGNREKSEQFMRIYDKKAKEKTDYHWLRIEVVTKGDYAKLLFFDMTQNGVSQAGNNKINSIVKFYGVGWWDYAVQTTGLPTPKTNAESDTQKWLMGTVMSAIKNQAKDEKGREFLEKFMKRVEYAILEGLSNSDVSELTLEEMDFANREYEPVDHRTIGETEGERDKRLRRG